MGTVDGVGAAIYAGAANFPRDTSGGEMAPSVAKEYASVVRRAQEEGIPEWQIFDVLRPACTGNSPARTGIRRAPRVPGIATLDSLLGLTWQITDATFTAKACPAVEEFEDPNLIKWLVEAAGCVGLRPSRLQLIPPSAAIKQGL